MKTFTKLLGITGAAIATCAVASIALDYRKMKKKEDELQAMPMYKLKNKFSRIQATPEKTVIEIPNTILFADKLRICASILASKKQGDDCCAEME